MDMSRDAGWRCWAMHAGLGGTLLAEVPPPNLATRARFASRSSTEYQYHGQTHQPKPRLASPTLLCIISCLVLRNIF